MVAQRRQRADRVQQQRGGHQPPQLDRGTDLRGARAEALTRIATHNTIASANFHACVGGTIIDSPTMITRKRREIKCGELVGGPQTSSPWRIVFSVTARGSTNWSR